jgi:hypothetical protein
MTAEQTRAINTLKAMAQQTGREYEIRGEELVTPNGNMPLQSQDQIDAATKVLFGAWKNNNF